MITAVLVSVSIKKRVPSAGKFRSTTRENADNLLASFAHNEERRHLWQRTIRGLLVGAGPTLLAASIGSLFSQPFGMTTYTWLHYALWAATLLAIPASLLAYRHEIGEYLTNKRLQAMYQQHALPSPEKDKLTK
jgi:hypothetical protein